MKKLTAKIGEYQKDGATKGRYTNVGVVMSNANGEYLLLDPSISIAGIYAQQVALATSKGEKVQERVMVGMWEEDGASQAPQQSAPQQSAPSQPFAKEIADYKATPGHLQQTKWDSLPPDVREAIMADFK